jgi:hypothetical protein
METYVLCPICNKKFKELNTAHLKVHGLNVKTFDEKYPDYDRLSIESRNKKATFTGKTHTEEYKKYMSERTMGFQKGRKLSDEHKRKISEMSKKVWENSYDKMVKSRNLEGYIEKYGEKEGKLRWFNKNKKNSMSSRYIKEGDAYKYTLYINLVRRITKLSIKKYGLKGFKKRSREYHIDHKIPIAYGFNKKIPAFVIGSIYNLEMLDSNINCSKQHLLIKDDPIELLKRVKNDEYYQEIKGFYLNEEKEIRSERKI